MAYHVVDNNCGHFFPSQTKVSTNDQLLYMLHKEGFTPRELCIIFELNNINSVYVKCHRINKNSTRMEYKRYISENNDRQASAVKPEVFTSGLFINGQRIFRPSAYEDKN